MPYGYAPVIAYDARSGRIGEEELRRFVQATRKGYEIAMTDPGEAARCLQEECRPRREKGFLEESQQVINEYYADGGVETLGRMEDRKWETWVSWLRNRGLLRDEGVDYRDLYTNEFFKEF